MTGSVVNTLCYKFPFIISSRSTKSIFHLTLNLFVRRYTTTAFKFGEWLMERYIKPYMAIQIRY